ncbi:hypothetical protein NBT05_10960 [Aquimarina sp. ERC-38]|uniref:hypothetical protein n=1 Tax=Aquimarina sp. ERC-38 TaxID=2949996 RepID=UPI002246A7B4|nr:hypothetical protein [Aquimarina sp. ERC-38]UZO79479.1 hypothetical protein NBT05_10960 [Aquimarina sp. ERC-38]
MKKYYLFSLLCFTSLSVFSYAVWLIIDMETLQFKATKNLITQNSKDIPLKTATVSNKNKTNTESALKNPLKKKLIKPLPIKVYSVSSLKEREPSFAYYQLSKKDSFCLQKFRSLNFKNDLLRLNKDTFLSTEDESTQILSSF